MSELSGTLGDIFWDLAPAIVYSSGSELGTTIYVANPTDEAKEYALYVTTATGGRGAVREVCDLLLQAQGKWDEILRRYA